MYSVLRKGDRLPTVAAIQLLLNRSVRRGTYVGVDGWYGEETRNAVLNYQSEFGVSGSPNGIIRRAAWKALTRPDHLQVIDAVDVTEEQDLRIYSDEFHGIGYNPIFTHGMSNGVTVVTDRIMARARSNRVVLLRFHGHGNRGRMVLSSGTSGKVDSMFSLAHIDSLGRFLSRMRPIFCRFGSVELHGCNVAGGAQGRRLLRSLSVAFGVPVTAAIGSQFGGIHNGISYGTYEFEGPVVTACPGGSNLRSWARTLPNSGGMSVFR